MARLKLKYIGEVKDDGTLKIYGRKSFDNDIKGFIGERIVIEVSKYQKDKSIEQRGYYRAIIVPEVLEGLVDIGYPRYQLSLDIVHDMLKEKFLTKEIVSETNGKFLKVIQSTEDLTMPEYANFIQNCIDWSLEYLSIIITPPTKQGIINY